MAFRPGERSTDAIAGPAGLFAATTVQIPVSKARELAEGAQLPLQGVLGLDRLALRGRIGAAVLQGMKRLADDIFLQPEAPLPAKIVTETADMMYEQMLVLLTSLAAPTQPRILPAFHRVRAAEEIMDAQTEAPFSMIDLARQLGSACTACNWPLPKCMTASPLVRSTTRSACSARQRLLDASERDQITNIALDDGFLHLCRFAQSSARTFGELPSETLARRRT